MGRYTALLSTRVVCPKCTVPVEIQNRILTDQNLFRITEEGYICIKPPEVNLSCHDSICEGDVLIRWHAAGSRFWRS